MTSRRDATLPLLFLAALRWRRGEITRGQFAKVVRFLSRVAVWSVIARFRKSHRPDPKLAEEAVEAMTIAGIAFTDCFRDMTKEDVERRIANLGGAFDSRRKMN